VHGEGEPLLLIPYLSADHACYAFRLPAYTEHFSCIALDLPGTGESDKPAGPYSTEIYADQVAAFLGAIGVEQAHVAGVSLGAGVGMHLAARHPGRVRSLSLHSAWDTSDLYLKTIVELWRTVASTLPSVVDAVIQAIFPLCFTPEMYVSRPEFADTLADFVRGRPAQPLDAFLAQTEAAMAHDVSPVLGEIDVPSLITVGARDLVCSPRFAERINTRIGGSEQAPGWPGGSHRSSSPPRITSGLLTRAPVRDEEAAARRNEAADYTRAPRSADSSRGARGSERRAGSRCRSSGPRPVPWRVMSFFSGVAGP
jgi:pimeloyl-ACP methyl ester carboxylesterase